MAKKCKICDTPIDKSRTYCNVCKRLAKRARGKENIQKLEAIKQSYNKNDNCFYCYYTKVKLEIEDSSSPFYLTFDHKTPRMPDEIVACTAFVNDMKTDSAEEEFKQNVNKLNEIFTKNKKFKQSDFSLSHWKR